MDKKQILFGSLLCLLAVTAWGFMFPVMASALQFIDPFFFTTFRYGSAAIIFIILLFIIEGKSAFHLEKQAFYLLFYGTVGFAGYGFLVFYGQQLAGPSGAIHAAMIQSLMPILALLLQWVLKKKKPQNYTFLCMFCALIGVLLVISKGNIHMLFGAAGHVSTNILMLSGVICWVIYTNGGSHFPTWSPLRYTTLTCLFGSISLVCTVIVLTYMKFISIPTFYTIATVRFELLYMSIIAGVVAVFCWNMGNRLISSINGILFMNLVPVLALIGSIFRGYQIEIIEIIGAIITIIALLCNNLWQRKQERIQEEIKP
ncbi:DMT family transporter [Bacillus sp. 166amftsu]|uniref:DMT family transporter n=1 Tax=Bacillus sp. 166amftsu TaxID=1761753 RepID=UPI00089AC3EA|nr:DMT family transporter [Bacillus sp. 166amftsu]SDY58825.1 Permease of the drug/metabolite transporter (DMT) superfamily [Bacillus sp. 166amftsu]